MSRGSKSPKSWASSRPRDPNSQAAQAWASFWKEVVRERSRAGLAVFTRGKGNGGVSHSLDEDGEARHVSPFSPSFGAFTSKEAATP